MSQESQEKPGGNTMNPPDKTRAGPKNQLYRWFFTLKMECLTASQLSQELKGLGCKEFTFQGEKGKEGFEHWQGVFSLKNKEYFGTVKNWFPNSIHLEPCKDWIKARKYCEKSETRIEGPYTEQSIFLEIITKLNTFQQKVVDDGLFDNDRTIWWYWDEKGGIGKSSFCKWAYVHLKAEVFKNSKSDNIAYAVSNNPKIIIFDLSRSIEGHINYGIIEDLKNGMVFSGKYESRTKVFNSPRIIIFANFEPDTRKMSMDRWNIQKF